LPALLGRLRGSSAEATLARTRSSGAATIRFHAEHLAPTGTVNVLAHLRALLELHLESRAGLADVVRVLELPHPEPFGEQRQRPRQVIDRHHDVQVLRHDGLRVRVHGDTADGAVADTVLLQQPDDAFEEIAPVLHNRLPEGQLGHAA
jgi:hypothetical protein